MANEKVNNEGMNKGYFTGNVFNNGRIMMVIKEDYARIFTSDGSRILVEKFYPELDIFKNNTWERVNFTKHVYMHNNSAGWHFVTIFMKNESKISMTLTYAEKPEFRTYAPLFPHLELRTEKPFVEYRVIWHLEGVGIRNFAIIKNETQEIIYNGTVHPGLRFERGQNIIIGYEHGRKMFGLNWENYKERLPVLEVKKGKELGIDLKSDTETATVGVDAVPPGPIPDTGGGGGGGTQQDSDGDGVDDDVETNGWYAWWYDSSGNYHRVLVTSNPFDEDTDDDGLTDYYEWTNDLNPRNADTDGDGVGDYYELNYGTPNDGWQNPHWYNHRYAVIIVGGGYNDPYENETQGDNYYPAFWNDGLEMYKKLVNDYHYSSSNVYLLSSRWYSKYDGSWAWRGENPSTDSRVDGEAMWDSPNYYDIKDALDEIGNKITVYDSLMIVIITHGGPGGFEIRADIPSSTAEEHPNTQATSMSYESFSNYINSKFGNGNNKKYAVMIVVNQACYSGTMMDHLQGENRILITAADSTHESYTEAAFNLGDYWLQQPYQHWAFIYQGREKKLYDNGQLFFPTHDGFIKSLGNIQSSESLSHAFICGDNAQYYNGKYDGEKDANPQMDWNGLDPTKVYL